MVLSLPQSAHLPPNVLTVKMFRNCSSTIHKPLRLSCAKQSQESPDTPSCPCNRLLVIAWLNVEPSVLAVHISPSNEVLVHKQRNFCNAPTFGATSIDIELWS